VLDQTLDGAVLACAIATFENDENTRTGLDEVALQLHELDLQLPKRTFVVAIKVAF
jgi:hypothetical protein